MKLGQFTLRNRIQSAPMGYYGTPEGYLTKDGMAYYELRARGGVAIVTIGESMVDSSGTSHGRVTPLDDPGILPSLIDTTDSIKRHGAVASIELLHAGTRSRTDRPDGAVYGPSAGTSFYGKPIIEMDDAEIDRVVNAFGDASAMAKRGGCQMVMVHGGHGWLLSQFLSPLHNQRTDQFGGSIENRTRFLSMIVDDIRKKCGPNFPLEMRLSGDEFTEGGMELPEVVEVAKILDEKVDLFNVSATTFNDTTAGLRMFPSVFLPRGANVYLAEEIAKAVETPVNTVGALNDPANMEDILSRGLDMVTLGRALLADPFLPEKARKGLENDITPCIRCNYCISQSFTPYVKHPTFVTRCVVNPVIGREYETMFQQPSAGRKKVLVAGGGPGGMQAAITAADRGHEVVLCEKGTQLGGALLYSKEYFKEDLGKLVDVLERRVRSRPIELMMETEVTPEFVKEVFPDVLIVAVGAEPLIPPISGVEFAVIAASLYDEDAIGDRVVVVGGGQVGCEKALHMAHLGKDVTLVEMLDTAASDASYLHWLALTRELEKNVTLELGTKCFEITGSVVYARDQDDQEKCFPADTVLLATGMMSRTELVESLRGSAPDFSVIGDCYQPGTVLEAIQYGYFTALNL
ncbi:FAD-dependent oxidoreductase [Candidatus Bathyarchaeota archaeon]|nr:FAD-dependent oxidoreductase [Candidatus Bathyarchaeota archaeon]MBT7186317.1 FAD-dependent oxidoreductase [Candidatus Bathyarchaeota archaeon]